MDALMELQVLKQARARSDSLPTHDPGLMPNQQLVDQLQLEKLGLQQTVGIKSILLILFIFSFFYALLGFLTIVVVDWLDVVFAKFVFNIFGVVITNYIHCFGF